MSQRLAVLLGLLAGVATAILALAAILALVPGPVHPTPTPIVSTSPVESSPPPVVASPSIVPSASASPSTAPSVEPSSSIGP